MAVSCGSLGDFGYFELRSVLDLECPSNERSVDPMADPLRVRVHDAVVQKVMDSANPIHSVDRIMGINVHRNLVRNVLSNMVVVRWRCCGT